MKNLEPEAIEQLLSIVPNHPASSIMEFSNGDETLSKAMKTLCEEKGYHYQLNVIDEALYTKYQALFAQKDCCIVRKVQWEQRRYASIALLYYVVFVSMDVPDEKREAFLCNVLHHIKTSGHLVIFVTKNDQKRVDEWLRVLEEKLFVSISRLDISENCDIIVARRMHGWGQ